MSFAVFILVVLIVPDLLFWRWAHRRVRHLPGGRWVLGLFMGAMLAHALLLITFPGLGRRIHHYAPMGYVATAYLWHLLILPISGILLLLTAPLRRAPTVESRRAFLTNAVSLMPPVAAGATTLAALPYLGGFRVRHHEIALPSLPRALDGMTIAHVSDLHYGKFVREESARKIADAVNEQQADLVLFTGDLIDLTMSDFPGANDFLRRLDPRQGLFLCEGNHDLIEDPDHFRRRIKQEGWNLLLDEVRTVTVRGEKVQIGGVSWRRDMDTSARQVEGMLDPAAFSILLAHHPHYFDHARGFGLQLSGHTHGGQIMLNEKLGWGPVLYRYWSGLYRDAGRALVVSNGVGNWFPVRLHAPAEIARITLRSA